MYQNHNMAESENQGALFDVSSTGKARPWREKKEAGMKLALAYDAVDPKKAQRLRECASFLVFKRLVDDTLKLHSTNLCRVRLCPMCAWRRSLKTFAHTQRIMEAVKMEKEKYAYIFLTLTVRNCTGDELNNAIDAMMEAWHRFMGYKAVVEVVRGWYRGLEVTHNVDFLSESYDTYHPHFHCLLVVDQGYFKGRSYLSQVAWTSFWKKAMRLDYDPVVDVRRVKGDTAQAVAEAAKYTVKETDYILPDDWELTIDTVRLLDKALADRRLVAYGGLMKEWHKRLNLDDEMDGDLIHIDDEQKVAAETDKLMVFVWHTGYNQYFLQG